MEKETAGPTNFVVDGHDADKSSVRTEGLLEHLEVD